VDLTRCGLDKTPTRRAVALDQLSSDVRHSVSWPRAVAVVTVLK